MVFAVVGFDWAAPWARLGTADQKLPAISQAAERESSPQPKPGMRVIATSAGKPLASPGSERAWRPEEMHCDPVRATA
jgi:hypothetical protein